MNSIEIKGSRRIFTCTNKDKIMYNGSIYQLSTQKYQYERWYQTTPIISKTEFNRLFKLGVLSEPYEKLGFGGIKLIMYDFVLDR